MNYVEVIIWSIEEGVETELKFNGKVWIPKNDNAVIVKPNPPSCTNKKNYFIKYLDTKKPGEIFSLEDFYKLHPAHKNDNNYRKRLDKTISDLIQNKRITMWVKDGEFKVLK